jgi:hypothetical protein
VLVDQRLHEVIERLFLRVVFVLVDLPGRGVPFVEADFTPVLLSQFAPLTNATHKRF